LEEFAVNITEEELASIKDENGDTRFYKVVEWLFPKFDSQTFREWLAARMRNYMLYLINTTDWNPQYYDPSKDSIVLADYVVRFFSCQSARMLCGSPSIKKTWSACKPLDAIGIAKESMPKNAFQDIHRCLHFTDNW